MVSASEFDNLLIGWPTDGDVRLEIVAAIDERAKELQADGNRSLAGLLRYCSSELGVGSRPSKKSMTKANKELKLIRERIVR